MPITSLFDLLSLFYAFISVRTIVALVKRGKSFWTGPLDAANRKLAYEVGFFLIIPIGVLLHEFGHAVATWMLGGTVAEFSWRVFWGFVRPVGVFTAGENWWIALSGNVVSIVMGLALLAAGYFGVKMIASVRYVLLQAGFIETGFALIVYPLMSVVGFGDWRTIYDFTATPALSYGTAAVHAFLLGILLKFKRQGRLESKLWGLAAGREGEIAALEAAVRNAPSALQPRVQLAEYYMAQGNYALAEQSAKSALGKLKSEPGLYYLLGKAVAAQGRPSDAIEPLTKGLKLAATKPDLEQTIRANLAIALAASGRNKDALAEFEELRGPLRDDWSVQRWKKRAMQAEVGAGQ